MDQFVVDDQSLLHLKHHLIALSLHKKTCPGCGGDACAVCDPRCPLDDCEYVVEAMLEHDYEQVFTLPARTDDDVLKKPLISKKTRVDQCGQFRVEDRALLYLKSKVAELRQSAEACPSCDRDTDGQPHAAGCLLERSISLVDHILSDEYQRIFTAALQRRVESLARLASEAESSERTRGTTYE